MGSSCLLGTGYGMSVGDEEKVLEMESEEGGPTKSMC